MRTVRVVNDSGMGFGTKVFDVESGLEFKGITHLTVDVVPEDVIKVELNIAVAYFDIKGSADFNVFDPRDGKLKPVAKIIWADGTPDFDAETGI